MKLFMQQIPVKFSLEEIQALLEMVENQLFRMKFIDSKIPGHKPNPEKQRVSNSAVNTLQEAYKKAKGFKSKDAA
jgi:cob(I)alamin adenosyltransferase